MSLIPLSGDPNIDGLLWGVKWDLNRLNYGFATSTSQYSGYQFGSISGFQTFNAAQKAATDDVIAHLNGLFNLNIVFNANGTLANLRYAEASSVTQYVDPDTFLPVPGTITTAVGTPPDPFFAPDFAYGDIFFNSSLYNTPQKGNFAYATILHETGHALGLKHGHSAQDFPDGSFVIAALPANRDGMEFSVMTYRSEVGGPSDSYSNERFGYAQTYMMNDIAALQYLYGADYGFNSGQTVYTWSPTTGEMFVNGAGQGTPGANRVFLTIWDGGGNDTYDMSGYTTGLSVNLAPGNWSVLSRGQLAELNTTTGALARANVFNALLHEGDLRSLIENATGGSGKDVLRGNVAGNILLGNDSADKLFGLVGNDRLGGGNGGDRLIGGIGADLLVSGSGNDAFVFNAPGEGNDTIADFSTAGFGNNDRFEFSGANFGGLAGGALGGTLFQSSNAAVAGSSAIRFLFELDTQILRYDADGQGGVAAVIIATLQVGAQIGLNDFLIV